MGRCRDQKDVAGGILSELLKQVMALLATSTSAGLALNGACVGFINDDQFRTGLDKVVASGFGFDVVHGNDGERKDIKNRAIAAVAVEA